MGLDINLIREDKGIFIIKSNYLLNLIGGDPNIVRDSQKKRFKPVELVDNLIEMDL